MGPNSCKGMELSTKTVNSGNQPKQGGFMKGSARNGNGAGVAVECVGIHEQVGSMGCCSSKGAYIILYNARGKKFCMEGYVPCVLYFCR